MLFPSLSSLLAPLVCLVIAQEQVPAAIDSIHPPLPDGKFELQSTGIRAQFVPYGASLSNLFIRDIHNEELDIVLGFDNASFYSSGPWHPHLNGVPGRYANRIRNGTFTIDGETFHTTLNDNGGLDTIHGGANGWDWRNWTVVAHTIDSITFSLVDPAGEEGFPGQVISYVTYTLSPHQWHIRMSALSRTARTPIMLSSHTYLNLDGFRNRHTGLALNHTLRMPFAKDRIATDNILIPTGKILGNRKGGVFDFWSKPKQIGEDIASPDIRGACGFDCSGYDTCFTFARPEECSDWRTTPVATLASAYSGIQLDIYTNQAAMQLYSCNNMNGTFPLKSTQGLLNGTPRVVNKYGCVVLEVEDWIDGINHPEWGRDNDQIFGPEDDMYVLEATYDFSLNREVVGEFEDRW